MWLLTKSLSFVKSPKGAALVGLLGLILAAYQTWFYERKSFVAVEIISDASVVDINATVSKLDVVYGGESLKRKGLGLRSVVLRIKNSGQVNIRKEDFDVSAPLGFLILNGKLLEEPSFVASSDYLTQHARLVRVNENQVAIQPILFDTQEWVQVQILVATANGSLVDVRPIGKISGIKEIQLYHAIKEVSKRGWWKRVIGADAVWVQFVRIFVYPIGFICFYAVVMVISIAVMIPIINLSERKDEKKLANLAKEYSLNRSMTIADQLLVKGFEKHGGWVVEACQNYILKVKYFNTITSAIREHVPENAYKKLLLPYSLCMQIPSPFTDRPALIREENGKILIHPEVERAVSNFTAYLIEKKQMTVDNVPAHSDPEKLFSKFPCVHCSEDW